LHIYSKRGEKVSAQLAQNVKGGRRFPPSSAKMFWMSPKFENCYSHPHLDKFTPFFIIYGKVMEALQKHIGLDFLLFPLPFHQYQVKYAYLRFSEILRKHYGIPGSRGSHFLNKRREVLDAKLA